MRSIYVYKKIKKCEKITQYNLKIIRPSYSLAPKCYERIIGKTLTIGEEEVIANASL